MSENGERMNSEQDKPASQQFPLLRSSDIATVDRDRLGIGRCLLGVNDGIGELMNAQGNLKAARMIFDELIVNRQYRAKEAVNHRRAILEVPLETEDPTAALRDKKTVPTDAIAATEIAWRPLVIAFAAGMIVTIFAQWQWREIRRRRERGVTA